MPAYSTVRKVTVLYGNNIVPSQSPLLKKWHWGTMNYVGLLPTKPPKTLPGKSGILMDIHSIYRVNEGYCFRNIFSIVFLSLLSAIDFKYCFTRPGTSFYNWTIGSQVSSDSNPTHCISISHRFRYRCALMDSTS